MRTFTISGLLFLAACVGWAQSITVTMNAANGWAIAACATGAMTLRALYELEVRS